MTEKKDVAVNNEKIITVDKTVEKPVYHDKIEVVEKFVEKPVVSEKVEIKEVEKIVEVPII